MSARLQYSDEVVGRMLEELRRTGDPKLRDAVVEHMRPLVQHIARKFAGKEPLEDLESEGFLGLIRAVDRYTPGRGTRFSTFATHLVAGQIRHYLRDRGHLIRQPAWLQELNARVQKAASELEQRLHRAPTNAELALATNLTEEGIEELLSARQAAQIIRMEAPAEGDDDEFVMVDPEKFRSKDYVSLQLPIEDRIVLEGALEKLKEMERNVLHYFFFHDFNQSEIARKLGISCNYTGYVLRKGLKSMRERLPEERTEVRGLTGTAEVVDAATGVYSREYFETRLSEELSRAKRFDQSVSVCCLRLPAECPESVMRLVAETLRARTRKMDVVGRTGPREFGVIFPNTGVVADRVALRLAEQIYGAAGVAVHTASATYPEGGRNGGELFEAARTGLTTGPEGLPLPDPLTAPLPVGQRRRALTNA